MDMNLKELKNKIKGCWSGKSIGGTLGAPVEWFRQVNDIYDFPEEIKGKSLPNDDLDLQLLWLWVLEKNGIDVSSQTLADAFSVFVTPHWSEYGTCKANMKLGLMPPLCGYYNNLRKDCNGAFIRSEIWACICAGNPALAAQYMYKDAIIDHGGDAEGLYAAIFMVTMQSAAFVETDLDKLVDIGLSYIPESTAVYQAVKFARELAKTQKDFVKARNALIDEFKSRCQTYFYYDRIHIDASSDDIKNNRYDGKEGWNAPLNMGLVVYSLLSAEGDLGKAICTAVNCGEDTDCTAATIGALLGIIYGYDDFPEEWKNGVGEGIVTMCLNLGELGNGGELPHDINSLTDRVVKQMIAVSIRYGSPIEIKDVPFDTYKPTELEGRGRIRKFLYRNLTGPVFDYDNYEVMVSYPDGAEIKTGETKKFCISIRNKFTVAENIKADIYFKNGLKPSVKTGHLYLEKYLTGRETSAFSVNVTAEELFGATAEGVVELSVIGKSAKMCVPITFVNGDLGAEESKPVYDY